LYTRSRFNIRSFARARYFINVKALRLHKDVLLFCLIFLFMTNKKILDVIRRNKYRAINRFLLSIFTVGCLWKCVYRQSVDNYTAATVLTLHLSIIASRVHTHDVPCTRIHVLYTRYFSLNRHSARDNCPRSFPS